jgi:beta-glucosidase
VAVSVDVTNTGARAGDEVPQLYVQHTGSKVERPIRDLRGYSRVTLRPGQTRTVTFRVPVSSLAYWDAAAHSWIVEAETVRLGVGASSRDLRASGTLALTGGRPDLN